VDPVLETLLLRELVVLGIEPSLWICSQWPLDHRGGLKITYHRNEMENNNHIHTQINKRWKKLES
jgi:hypothetical protein